MPVSLAVASLIVSCVVNTWLNTSALNAAIFTGVMLLSGHVLMTATGTGFGSFASALVLLGVGWNFLYIGGTALLTTTHTPAEKSSAQATNDMTVFVVGLACSFGAAPLLQAFGWQTLNLLLLPWLALAALALLALARTPSFRQ